MVSFCLEGIFKEINILYLYMYSLIQYEEIKKTNIMEKIITIKIFSGETSQKINLIDE